MIHHDEYFLGCHDCGELLPILPRGALGCEDLAENDLTRCNEFLTKHQLHRTACFCRSHSELLADRPLWDPMATLVFEVTDGGERYAVTATRPSIEEARSYRFAPGSLVVATAEVAVDRDHLRRGLDSEFFPHALRATKVDRFLTAVNDVIRHLRAAEIETIFDAADDPAVSIAPMPEDSYRDLVDRCAGIFDALELPRVLAFIDENRREDGLLALRVRRHVDTLTA